MCRDYVSLLYRCAIIMCRYHLSLLYCVTIILCRYYVSLLYCFAIMMCHYYVSLLYRVAITMCHYDVSQLCVAIILWTLHLSKALDALELYVYITNSLSLSAYAYTHQASCVPRLYCGRGTGKRRSTPWNSSLFGAPKTTTRNWAWMVHISTF